MDVRFTQEQEAQLAHIAASTGVGAEQLVKDAALGLIEDGTRSVAASWVAFYPHVT
jgi:hypothetical protein